MTEASENFLNFYISFIKECSEHSIGAENSSYDDRVKVFSALAKSPLPHGDPKNHGLTTDELLDRASSFVERYKPSGTLVK